jgi:ribonuclease
VLSVLFSEPPFIIEQTGLLDGSLTLLWILQTYVSCKPETNDSGTKVFKVDVDNAKSQAKAAGFVAGKSGDPHGYENHEKITWGVQNCDSGKIPLYEYMIYWEGAKQKEWQKDTKTSNQEKTPIRVVYANKNGGNIYCGVAIKSNVDKTFQGSGAFLKCS